MPRRSPLLLALVLVIPPVPAAFACLQVGAADEHRLMLIDQVEQARELRQTMAAPIPATYEEQGSSKFTTGSWLQLQEEALARIFEGRYGLAIDLLQKAESAFPGNYSIAANLGTAYELDGQNPNALRWIAESLRRNPDSHRKTEWVHLILLQAKVRRERDPAAPFAPLVPLPARFSEDTLVSVAGATYPMQEVKRAIHYQLRERMKFVKPRDIYVADLLFTLSRIDAPLYGPKSAYEYVKLAETYGYPDASALETDKRSYFWPVPRGRIFSVAAQFLEIFAITALIAFPLWLLCAWLNRAGLLRFRRS